jgi:hypothetical protein
MQLEGTDKCLKSIHATKPSKMSKNIINLDKGLSRSRLTANFVQTHHKHGKMKKLKEVNKIWQHIRWIYAKEY